MKIISVKPVPEFFSLTWMLGSRCNYDCMYCPTELHDSTSKPHDLETMQKVWMNIFDKTKHKNLPFKICFTGGEVTTNRNFLPLVQWLKENFPSIACVMLTTNGSASKDYYLKLANYVEAISFSIHSEYIDEKKFFDTVQAVDKIMVRPKKSLHVNIMDEFWNQSRITVYKDWLMKNNIDHSVNVIDYTLKHREHVLQNGKYNLEV